MFLGFLRHLMVKVTHLEEALTNGFSCIFFLWMFSLHFFQALEKGIVAEAVSQRNGPEQIQMEGNEMYHLGRKYTESMVPVTPVQCHKSRVQLSTISMPMKSAR